MTRGRFDFITTEAANFNEVKEIFNNSKEKSIIFSYLGKQDKMIVNLIYWYQKIEEIIEKSQEFSSQKYSFIEPPENYKNLEEDIFLICKNYQNKIGLELGYRIIKILQNHVPK